MKISKSVVLATILTILAANPAKAQNCGDLLGGGLSDTLGNVIEGVFSSSKISIEDMNGEWTADGSAVCFQSEGFLQKAGGIAAASAIESKLNPYYQQYGLNNALLTVNSDATFTLACKSIKLQGNITKSDKSQDGVFEFNFTVLGRTIGSVTTYVQKSSRSMDVMFDATKLKKLVSAIGKFSGMSTIQTLTSLLDSYDGLCVGFHFTKTGEVNNGQTDSNKGFRLGDIFSGNSYKQAKDSIEKTGSETIDKGKDTIKQGKESIDESKDAISTGLDKLRGLFGM